MQQTKWCHCCLFYLTNHCVRPVGSDCVFDIVIDIFFMRFSLVLSTGAVKNKRQEQSISVYVFHYLFTQQPPLRGTRLKITLLSRST